MSPSALKALGKLGFEVVSTRGSHCKLRSGSAVAIVPLRKELAASTLASILRQAGISADALKAAL